MSRQATDAEVRAVLDALPASVVVRVRESNGEEDIYASLAVSVAKLAALLEEERKFNARLWAHLLADGAIQKWRKVVEENAHLVPDTIRAVSAAHSRQAVSLPARVVAMCEARGWGFHWEMRASVLFSEVAELVEAYRGKRSSVVEEAADVVISTMAITQKSGVSWDEVIAYAEQKVALLTAAEKPKKA